MSEREYYLAGGSDLEKAIAFIEERNETSAKILELGKKYGGQPVTNGRLITGMLFDKPPEGWTKKGTLEDGKPFYMPKRTSKALKAIHEDLRSVRMKSAPEFHDLFCKGGGHIASGDGRGYRILYTVWEWIGDTLLLSVPVGADFTPNGSRKLKMSEYWALKESASLESSHD